MDNINFNKITWVEGVNENEVNAYSEGLYSFTVTVPRPYRPQFYEYLKKKNKEINIDYEDFPNILNHLWAKSREYKGRIFGFDAKGFSYHFELKDNLADELVALQNLLIKKNEVNKLKDKKTKLLEELKLLEDEIKNAS